MIGITLTDLAIAGGLVGLLGLASIWQRLSIAGELLVASVRMAIQLLLVGWVLKGLFEVRGIAWVAAVVMLMLGVAGREVVARQKRRLAGWRAWGIGTGSLFVSSLVVGCIGLGAIIQPEPWYHPQYAIPLVGMLLGNTMTGVALCMDRLTSGIWQQREVIEQRLMLGEDARGASMDLVRESVRSAFTPIINAMAVAGLVSLPGMMTGQILSGVEPTVAVRYQILIWLLIATGSGLGMMLAARLTCRSLFDERDRLRLDRLGGGD
tara:strand:+ start:92 stop:886 length:795 start_codon:yes stop_codon:yes gene_type:complete